MAPAGRVDPSDPSLSQRDHRCPASDAQTLIAGTEQNRMRRWLAHSENLEAVVVEGRPATDTDAQLQLRFPNRWVGSRRPTSRARSGWTRPLCARTRPQHHAMSSAVDWLRAAPPQGWEDPRPRLPMGRSGGSTQVVRFRCAGCPRGWRAQQCCGAARRSRSSLASGGALEHRGSGGMVGLRVWRPVGVCRAIYASVLAHADHGCGVVARTRRSACGPHAWTRGVQRPSRRRSVTSQISPWRAGRGPPQFDVRTGKKHWWRVRCCCSAQRVLGRPAYRWPHLRTRSK